VRALVGLPLLALIGCAAERAPIDPAEVHAIRLENGALCLYSVLEEYDPGRAWPMIFALHGYGSGAARFHDLWRGPARRAGFVLLTAEGGAATPEGIGRQWSDDAEGTIRGAVNALREIANIDDARIDLAGFSQGGRLTWSVGLRYPRVFRGLAPLGASFDESLVPDPPSGLPGLRVYVGHGALEPNLAEARGAVAILSELGCEVRFAEYSGVGHGLPSPVPEELDRILSFLASN
jgi:phospholipase/carboxylesterase